MKRVLVIGDAIADVYRSCTFKKMCPDAPGVRAVVESCITTRAGGAANVAVNLVWLAPNVQVDLIAVVDTKLARVIKGVSKNVINLKSALFRDYCITKERIIVDGQMAIRVDTESTIDNFDATTIGTFLSEYLRVHTPDLIIYSDYAGGTVNSSAIKMLLKYGDRLLIDTKETNLSIFGHKKVLLAKLNSEEWRAVVESGDAAPEHWFKALIVTNGAQGANVLINEQIDTDVSATHSFDVRGHSVNAVDVCGCGDTFMAGLAASLLTNDDIFTAAQFANAAAATVVTQPRTAVADRDLTLKLLGRKE